MRGRTRAYHEEDGLLEDKRLLCELAQRTGGEGEEGTYGKDETEGGREKRRKHPAEGGGEGMGGRKGGEGDRYTPARPLALLLASSGRRLSGRQGSHHLVPVLRHSVTQNLKEITSAASSFASPFPICPWAALGLLPLSPPPRPSALHPPTHPKPCPPPALHPLPLIPAHSSPHVASSGSAGWAASVGAEEDGHARWMASPSED